MEQEEVHPIVPTLGGERQTYQQKTFRYVHDGRMDCVRVTDDKEEDPKQDRKSKNSVHEELDVRVDGGLLVHGVVRHETTTPGSVNAQHRISEGAVQPRATLQCCRVRMRVLSVNKVSAARLR